MSSIVSFDDFKGLTPTQAKANVGFFFETEKTISDVTGLSVRRNAVFRTDAGENGNEKRLLGLVPDNRPVIPYSEVTDWFTDELDKTGINYKIIDSVVHGKNCSMQQRYVLDLEIGNPDGYKLSPMLVLESSYTGVPVSYEMGVFRFICSNGAAVSKEIFERQIISARRLNDFGRVTIGDGIRRGLDKIVALKDTYQRLDNEFWTDYFETFLSSEKVDVEFKKHLISYLSSEGTVTPLVDKTLKNCDFLGSYILNGVLNTREDESILSIDTNKNKSGWDFYNDLTYIASHESSSLTIRDRTFRMISNVFAA